ncbi:sulfite exporter TauE/SafE family protein [Pseudonocardia kunmingensis]|uniref:Probable membrane transporter protein n=1 Tax=Pseudonocardia kunmingensis TaxID=630975 RepID=A0A543DP18_9PSEU|nr:sulfite exporter TauE/SafE family protein [Pseudonocardia kunmingensis]TQM11058.1 hypothetical protein FB558_3599 [Pseudonocardia kunmingensis]
MTGVLAGVLGLAVGLAIGTFGGGGGVLAVPALVYALGQDARTATTGSIIIVGLVSAAGLLARLRARAINWRTGVAFGIVGVPTAWAGSLANRAVPQPVLLLTFATLTLLVAVLMLVRTRSSRTRDGLDPESPTEGSGTAGAIAVLATAASTRTRVVRAVRVITSGAVVGFLTGFLGVGGGFLVVPALAMMLGLPMPLAIGTSLLVITINSVSSLVVRTGHQQLDWAVVLPFAAVAIAGALAGKLTADRMSSAGLSRAFAVLLLLVGGFVGIESALSIGGL